jgi:TRAP-type C4-dicarboxylate transport system permease small subunit
MFCAVTFTHLWWWIKALALPIHSFRLSLLMTSALLVVRALNRLTLQISAQNKSDLTAQASALFLRDLLQAGFFLCCHLKPDGLHLFLH